jgi:hypothetical protein
MEMNLLAVQLITGIRFKKKNNMIKKFNRFLFKNKLLKPAKLILNIFVLLSAVFCLEYLTNLSLFVKFAIYYTIVKFNKWISNY